MKQACFLPIECAFFGFKFDKNRLVNIYKVYIKISENQVFSWGLPRAATDAIYCGFEIFQTQHIVSFFFSTQFFDPFLGQNCIRIKKFRSIFAFSNGIYFCLGLLGIVKLNLL